MKTLKMVLALMILAGACPAATLVSGMTALSADTYTVPVSTFLPTDDRVVLSFGVKNAAVGDTAKAEYYYPDGTPLRTASWAALTSAGSFNFTSTNSIAGTPMASALGMYTAKVYWNGAPFFTLNFWIQNPGMTVDQKIFDFQVMTSLYAKQYANYDWKKTLFNYDALDLTTWLDRIRNTRDDVDYLDTLVQYVAALNDTHCTYRIPTSFSANLEFTVDVYFDGGRQNAFILIDSINRNYLTTAKYPFQTGDELLSIDGVKVADLLTQYLKYVSAASWDSGLRRAATYLVSRSQSSVPSAYQLGSTATVEIKRQSGDVETYTIPWVKSGIPLTRVGPVPMPKTDNQHNAEADEVPPYLRTLAKFQWAQAEPAAILNNGSLTPVWALPAGFQQRLGKNSTTDFFFTGTMPSGNFNVGYLRIPTFSPSSNASALQQLEKEIAYFQANTDGLVVDIMRNGGGLLCYGEQVLSRLMPANWRALGFQIRPQWADIDGFQGDLSLARALGSDQATVDLLQNVLNTGLQAYENGRGLTDPVSLCAAGQDRTPSSGAYSKPILLLTDEFTISTADMVAAQFQDNQRGKIYGWRTNGAGGSVTNQVVGFYSEGGTTRVVNTIAWRKDPVVTPLYPATNYIENVGVWPDITADYMNVDNFRQNGKPFVDGFLTAIAAMIAKSSQ